MFLGFSLSDIIPAHSTIIWNRRTRFVHTNIFEEIFDEMVGGRTLMADSTHIKANAKELHGYRYAPFRRLKSVQIQAYLNVACQNMKK